MRVFLWHVHGSWSTAMVQGAHEYLVPVLPGRGPDGRGRACTWDWPSSVVEVTPGQARQADIDVVILQRPQELSHLAEEWLGRRPGRDLPAVYLEHDPPPAGIAGAPHPAADHRDLTVVHVTHFNALMWDTGFTPTRVIEHGVVDPGPLYRGDVPRAVAVINEPVRRGRVTGTDLLEQWRTEVPIDLFGMKSQSLGGQDVIQAHLHQEMARRRLYLHPFRWTSLGLSLVEAMHLGLPVVALSTTEAPEAVPPGAGIVSNRPDVLLDAIRQLLADPEQARAMGRVARREALVRYGLGRFLDDWDHLLKETMS